VTTLVFVHGLGCDRSDWRRVIEALAPRIQLRSDNIVAPDLPGHGESLTPPRATVVELAQALIDEIRCDHLPPRSVVMVGHSLGCRVILEAAQHLGDRLAGIVFMDQNLVTHADLNDALALLTQRLDAMGAHEFLRTAFSGMFVGSTPATLRDRVLARIPRLDERFARELLLDSLAWEGQVPELLSSLDSPVLMLQSTWLDEHFQWRAMAPGMQTPWTRLVTARVRESELRVVPGVGHFLMIEAAGAVAIHLEEFVRRVVA
jgi:pimeloyl-ACP methyl ester carboxylesterase